jgi:hypothetical protein
LSAGFAADVGVHIHPPDAARLRTTIAGAIKQNSVLLPNSVLAQ